MRDGVGVGLDLAEPPGGLHQRDDGLAGREAVEAVERERLGFGARVGQEVGVAVERDPGLGIQDVDRAAAMTAADLEVVEIVRRRDLHRAGALLRVRVFVGDDRDQAADQRQAHALAHERGVALVLGVDGDRRVAQHRLGACRRHGDDLAGLGTGLVHDRIVEVPEVALHLDLLDLEVRDRGLELRVPVHEALVAVDQALRVQIDEDLRHRADHLLVGRAALTHGEALARPVAGGAEPLQLGDDGAARFRLPGPDLVEEGRAADLAAAGLLRLHHPALDDHLRGDAGMVHARLPQHVAPAHPLEAGQDVLQRVVERVTDMQRARHVRRRDDDAEGLGVGAVRASGAECVGLRPGGAGARLGVRRVEGLVHHGRVIAGPSRRSSPLSTRHGPPVNTAGLSARGRRARSRRAPAARPSPEGCRRATP